MRRITIAILVGFCQLLLGGNASGQSFQVMETSISEIHQAMQAGTLTCHALVEQYLNLPLGIVDASLNSVGKMRR